MDPWIFFGLIFILSFVIGYLARYKISAIVLSVFWLGYWLTGKYSYITGWSEMFRVMIFMLLATFSAGIFVGNILFFIKFYFQYKK